MTREPKVGDKVRTMGNLGDYSNLLGVITKAHYNGCDFTVFFPDLDVERLLWSIRFEVITKLPYHYGI